MNEQHTCDAIEPQLPDWLSGRLDPTVALAVAEHLDHCHRCRAAADDWRRFEAELTAHFAVGTAADTAAATGTAADTAVGTAADTAAVPAGLTARIAGALAASGRAPAARLPVLWLTAVAAALTLALMVLAVVGAGPGVSPAAADLTSQYWATLALQGKLLANALVDSGPVWVLTLLWTLAGLALAAALAREEIGRWTETLAPRGGPYG